MILLPILGRELRVQARNRVTYWTRSGVALVGILICLTAMGVGTFGPPPLRGKPVFNIVLGAAFLLSCCGCILTADAISAERREGTLELLFSTLVKPVDVLLGKLGSIGINGLCALAAFLPVLAIPLLAGGITGGEAFRKGLALMDTLFLSLMAGLFASAAEQDRGRAMRRAMLFVLLTIIIPYFIFGAATRNVPHYVGLMSPAVMMITAGDLRYFAVPRDFWCSLGLIHGLALLLLIGTVIRLRRSLRADGGETAARLVRKAEAERAVGLGTWEPVKGESSPVEWLVYRRYGVSGGIWGMALLALAYSGWVSLARDPAATSAGVFAWLFAWPLGITAGLLGGTMVAWIASRFFVGVRRSGDLELLMTTPLGAESIVSDQWQVLKRFFTWPVLVMQAPMLPQVLAGFVGMHHAGAAGWALHSGFYRLLCVANAVLSAGALCWLGMWFGFKARTQAGAIVWSVGLAKGIPALISLVFYLIAEEIIRPFAMSPATGIYGFSDTASYALATWIPEILNTLLFLVIIIVARQRLREELSGNEPKSIDLRGSIFTATRLAPAG